MARAELLHRSEIMEKFPVLERLRERFTHREVYTRKSSPLETEIGHLGAKFDNRNPTDSLAYMQHVVELVKQSQDQKTMQASDTVQLVLTLDGIDKKWGQAALDGLNPGLHFTYLKLKFDLVRNIVLNESSLGLLNGLYTDSLNRWKSELESLTHFDIHALVPEMVLNDGEWLKVADSLARLEEKMRVGVDGRGEYYVMHYGRKDHKMYFKTLDSMLAKLAAGERVNMSRFGLTPMKDYLQAKATSQDPKSVKYSQYKLEYGQNRAAFIRRLIQIQSDISQRQSLRQSLTMPRRAIKEAVVEPKRSLIDEALETLAVKAGIRADKAEGISSASDEVMTAIRDKWENVSHIVLIHKNGMWERALIIYKVQNGGNRIIRIRADAFAQLVGVDDQSGLPDLKTTPEQLTEFFSHITLGEKRLPSSVKFMVDEIQELEEPVIVPEQTDSPATSESMELYRHVQLEDPDRNRIRDIKEAWASGRMTHVSINHADGYLKRITFYYLDANQKANRKFMTLSKFASAFGLALDLDDNGVKQIMIGTQVIDARSTKDILAKGFISLGLQGQHDASRITFTMISLDFPEPPEEDKGLLILRGEDIIFDISDVASQTAGWVRRVFKLLRRRSV